VQNQYNFTQRQYEAVLDYCTEQNIGFIPWYPLAKGALSQPDSVFATIAKSYDATPGQIALAWLLKRSPVVIPIPGTSQQKHLEENVKALSIDLSDADFDAIAKINL
jgi:pyridoxine 4-dehydrogenase